MSSKNIDQTPGEWLDKHRESNGTGLYIVKESELGFFLLSVRKFRKEYIVVDPCGLPDHKKVFSRNTLYWEYLFFIGPVDDEVVAAKWVPVEIASWDDLTKELKA